MRKMHNVSTGTDVIIPYSYSDLGNDNRVFPHNRLTIIGGLWVGKDDVVYESFRVRKPSTNIYGEPTTFEDIEDVARGFAVDMGWTWSWDSMGHVVVMHGDYSPISKLEFLPIPPQGIFLDLDFDLDF
jgi:hypothetical protein